MTPQVKPLSYSHRNTFFYFLAFVFVAVLPFLYLYATGYRFQFGEQSFISTGGLYVAADRTGSEIYIDDELVRETRIFRKAFYAQGLEAVTHKVHVQKEGHHTWVKELPVYPHLVTEALAFNLPEVPDLEVISPWQTAAGVNVLLTKPTVLNHASTTNQYLYEPRASKATLEDNPNFEEKLDYFGTSTLTEETSLAGNLFGKEAATTTSTTSKEWQGVKLYEKDGEIYATYIGRREQMPYYYCAEDFPAYDPAASSTINAASVALADELNKSDIDLETQSVAEDVECEPIIKMDRGGEDVTYFDFFPNSSDLIILAEETGIYVVEIDDRAWQNRQPLLIGSNLEVTIVDGIVYAYDGTYIYRISINQNWF